MIVPGDIISIAKGEIIPCDMIIFKNNGGLEIDITEVSPPSGDKEKNVVKINTDVE